MREYEFELFDKIVRVVADNLGLAYAKARTYGPVVRFIRTLA